MMKNILVFLALALSTQAFSASDKDVFEKALQQYEKVHQAFFEDNLEKAKKEASSLKMTLEKLSQEEVKKTLTFTQKKLEGLKEQNVLKEAHKSFNVISQGLLVVLEKHLPNEKYARYYCPMVEKYWIQNITESEKVMNPYAAKSMPHCGGKVAQKQ